MTEEELVDNTHFLSVHSPGTPLRLTMKQIVSPGPSDMSPALTWKEAESPEEMTISVAFCCPSHCPPATALVDPNVTRTGERLSGQ